MFATHSQFSALDQQSAGRFDLLRAEIAASRDRMSQFDRQFEMIRQQFADVDRRFEQVDKRFDQVDARFSELTAYLTARFNLADTRSATMQQQIEQRLTIRLGTFMGIAIATVATLVTLLRP